MSKDIDRVRQKMMQEARHIEKIVTNPELMNLLYEIARVKTAKDWIELKRLWFEDSSDIDDLIAGFYEIRSPNFRTVGLYNFQLEKDSRFLDRCYYKSFDSK